MPERSPESYGSTNGRRAQRARRVLVVDDEESVRITTAAILEQEGYEVSTAESGREALAARARALRPRAHRPPHGRHGRPDAPARVAGATPERRDRRADGLRLHRVFHRR